MQRKITILGSTGSIGVSTLDVCRQHKQAFEVVALTAGKNIELLIQQIQEFKPKIVSLQEESDYQKIKLNLPRGVEVFFGEDGACRVAQFSEADLVISAIVGAAGLRPTLKAIEAKKTIGLANKESMVIAGEIMSKLAQKNSVAILPIDSEHSAIFQCLNGESVDDVQRLILTASGGPFLHTSETEFVNITKRDALNHPNWDMGAKVTIDSATMMNKGLEVMEARHLFDLSVDKIAVVVHPQSVIHSMVEFVDSSVMAQLGEPDMKVPIAYALSYPRRVVTNVKKLNLPQREKLTFFEPDLKKFPCLKLAFDVAKKGRSYPAVLNAANEVAVDWFLSDKIQFIDISRIVTECIQKHEPFDLMTLDDVFEADRWARNYCETL